MKKEYINRDITPVLREALDGGKVIVVYGSRQTGKTTIVEHLLADAQIRAEGVVRISGDVLQERSLLDYERMTVERAASIIGEAHTLFIDEAQKILDIGLTLKIIHDHFSGLRIVATGSSSFELSEEVGEPLTGRMEEYVLPPLSFAELAKHTNAVTERNMLECRMTYGMYPDVVVSATDARRQKIVKGLCSAYLFKDVLQWQNLRNSEMLNKLVKALALQLGNEVSYNEVGGLIGMDNETVQSYVERLERAFVVFRLPAFSRNLRNELKKSKKVYFCDVGIRNAVIGNFLPFDSREDVGHVFENYAIVERMKHNSLHGLDVRPYFWRTKGDRSSEIDYVEEDATGGLSAYEFKWNPQKAAQAKCPRSFAAAYPDAKWRCVSQDNYVEFITGRM